MAKFIRLHETSKTEVLVNVERINYIRDVQTDNFLKDKPDWRKTTVGMNSGVFLDVVETEKEIMNLIVEQL